ncbi:MAG: LCP family protein, partial [Gemmiger sp.]
MQERKNGVHAPEKEQRKKRPLWQKIAFGTGIALVAAIVLGVGYVNGKLDLIHYHDGSVDEVGSIGAEEDQDLDGTGLSVADGEMEMPEGSPFSDSDVLNILLIGTDERTEAVNDWDAFTHLNELDGTADTTEFSENARADTLILVSLNIREHTIKLVSIERGTGVPILLPEYEGQYDWITHTFRYGGARLTMETVEDCFNVKVDHYVRVNFNSFVQIVDAVGGIDIKLTELEAKALNWEVPSNSMLIVNKVHQGWNHFDGYTALQYARLRKIDNDWKRIERQRTVIQAVLDAVKSASVTELNDLLNTVLPLVQTDFTKTEIAALLIQVPGFLGAQAEQMSLPVEGSYGVRYGMDNRLMYDPDWTMNIRALHDFLYGENSDSDTYPLGEPEQTPETARPEPTPEPVETMEPEEYLAQNSAAVTLGYPLSAGTLGEGGAALYLD